MGNQKNAQNALVAPGILSLPQGSTQALAILCLKNNSPVHKGFYHAKNIL